MSELPDGLRVVGTVSVLENEDGDVSYALGVRASDLKLEKSEQSTGLQTLFVLQSLLEDYLLQDKH